MTHNIKPIHTYIHQVLRQISNMRRCPTLPQNYHFFTLFIKTIGWKATFDRTLKMMSLNFAVPAQTNLFCYTKKPIVKCSFQFRVLIAYQHIVIFLFPPKFQMSFDTPCLLLNFQFHCF